MDNQVLQFQLSLYQSRGISVHFGARGEVVGATPYKLGPLRGGTIEFALCAEEGRTEKENFQLIVELQRNEIARKFIHFILLE
jgi:hypothetical protein